MSDPIDDRVKCLPNYIRAVEALADIEYKTFNFSKIERKLDLKYIAHGSSRSVYALPTKEYILKGPRTSHGIKNAIESQLTEYLICKRFPNLPLAKCELYFLDAVPYIVMERVEPSANRGYSECRIAALAGFCDGDNQFGNNLKGIPVCYDYGYEIYYGIENMKPSKFDFTKEELNAILSFSPNLSTCPHYLLPQYSALTV